MRLNLNIQYGDRNVTINASVGDGSATIKWLAFMAAHRFTMLAPNGTIGPTMSNFGKSSNIILSGPRGLHILPKHIYTDKCSFLHPDSLVQQHFKDGDNVTIELYHEMPVDEYFIPQYSPWSYIAFHHGRVTAERRKVLEEQKMLEVREQDENRLKEEEEQRMKSNRPKIDIMKNILKEQLVDDETIEESMENDWNRILKCGVLDIIVPDLQERDEIKAFFTKYYMELSDIYKFFSAVNSGGGIHTLEYIEFHKFLTETGIFKQGEYANAILKIFIESYQGGKDDSGTASASIHSEIFQFEFFISLIKISVYKFITIAKREVALRKKKNHQASSITKASVPNIPQAIEMMYMIYLKPVVDRLTAGTTMKACLASDEVLLLLYNNIHDLFRVFFHYGDSPSEVFTNLPIQEYTKLDVIMSVKQFTTFASEAGYLGVASDEDGLNNVSMKDIRQIFSASQHDIVMNETENKMLSSEENKNSNSDHQEQMVFAEYLEAIVRLGVMKWRGDHFEGIQCAIQKVCIIASKINS